jgi:cytochrome c oxidase subunit II
LRLDKQIPSELKGNIMKTKYFLKILLFCGVTLAPVVAAGDGTPKTISITAQRFSFSPNEITVKKGEEITLEITSTDVKHGLVIEGLGVKTEIKKGQSAEVRFTPETAGTFEGKCAHFCGKGHGSMTMTVHVVE